MSHGTDAPAAPHRESSRLRDQGRSERLFLCVGVALWALGALVTWRAGGSVTLAVAGPGVMLAAFWWELHREPSRAARQGREPDPLAAVLINLPSYSCFPAMPVLMARGEDAWLLEPGAGAVFLGAVALVEGLLIASPTGPRVLAQLASAPIPAARRAGTRVGVALALLAGGAGGVVAGALGHAAGAFLMVLGALCAAKAGAMLAAR